MILLYDSELLQMSIIYRFRFEIQIIKNDEQNNFV